MVNFRDPSLIEKDEWAASKFWHAMAGLYLWEYVTTLDYEWGIIQGRRSSGWTIWIYSITRISTLMAVVLTLVSTNTTTEYNCQVETVFQLIFGYLSFAGASLLIVLRILAIWDMNKIVIGIATSVWGANVSFLIQGIVRIRAVWVPIETTCRITNTQSTKLNILITLVTDIVLLVIMLVGLLRLGFHERTAFGLGSYMWKQGLIWLFIATIAEVPPAVFICLNLNDPFNYMFQIPSIIAMSIAATRIHRNLVNYASGSSDVPSGPDSAQTSGRTGSKSIRGVDVAIRPTFEPYHQTPHTSQNDSFSGVEGQLREKPTGLVFDEDVENGAAETPT